MKKMLWTLIIALTMCLVLNGNALAKDKDSDDDSGGRAKLALTVGGDSTYVGTSSNPWFKEGWLTASNSFDLQVQNTQKTTNGSPIYFTTLVMSIPYDAPTTGWSFTLGSLTFNYSSFSQTGAHTYLNSHGVFAENGTDVSTGARWIEYATLGTINPQDSITLHYDGSSLPDGMMIHFDAYGSDSSTSQNGWYFAPYSHDVTVTPEPMSLLLYGVGGIPLAAHFVRRRKVLA